MVALEIMTIKKDKDQEDNSKDSKIITMMRKMTMMMTIDITQNWITNIRINITREENSDHYLQIKSM